MLFAFKRLRNISLASLSAECQDSVCKQSVHVRVVTWRKLLSCCPRSLTPEVNPDIDTYGASDVPRWRAAPESYHSVITSRRKTAHATHGREKKKKKSPQVIFGFANTDYVLIHHHKMLIRFIEGGVALVAKLHKRRYCFSKIGRTSSSECAITS